MSWSERFETMMDMFVEQGLMVHGEPEANGRKTYILTDAGIKQADAEMKQHGIDLDNYISELEDER